MEKPTHREICKAVASHLLREPWADAVCWELGVNCGQLDVLAVSASDLDRKQETALRTWESRSKWREQRGMALPQKPSIPPRVMAVEVKVSRSDLAAGIRRGQFQKYVDGWTLGTHYSLAIYEEALRRSSANDGWWSYEDRDVALADLSGLGVPAEWGVIRVSRSRGRDATIYVDLLRKPRRIRPAPGLEARLRLTEQMARSLAYRILGDGPERNAS